MRRFAAIKNNPRHLIALLLALAGFAFIAFVVIRAAAQCAPDDIICQSMP